MVKEGKGRSFGVTHIAKGLQASEVRGSLVRNFFFLHVGLGFVFELSDWQSSRSVVAV